MADVLVFPLARSPGFVRKVANILDAKGDVDAMTAEWRRRARATLDRFEENGVDRKAADRELVRLLHAVNVRLSERHAARARTVFKREERNRLRLVESAQGDLFASPTPARPAAQPDEDCDVA